MSSNVRLVARGQTVTDANRLPVDVGITAVDQGVLQYRNNALLATKAQVKATAGALVSLKAFNPNTVPVYLKIYNAASASVTVGSTVPQRVEMLPPGDGVTPGVLLYTPDSQPVEWFSGGITIAAVTGLADASTAAPGTAVYTEIDYK